MVNKFLSIILVLLICFVFFVGWTVPEGSPYITANTSVGSVIIYFNQNANNALIYDESSKLLLNSLSSSINGYLTLDNIDYTVRFPTYSIPYFTYNSRTTYITNWENIEFHNLNEYNSNYENFEIALLVIILVLLFFIFLRGK